MSKPTERTIKFRAWDGEKMHVLNLYQTYTYESDFVLREDNDESWIDDHCEEVRWPIMQFTGLKDSKGTDIYEGDIVRWKNKVIQVDEVRRIVFRKGAFVAIGTARGFTNPWPSEDFEVIGNIYESKELLGDTNE